MPDDEADAGDLGEVVERLAALLASEARTFWDAHGLHPVHGRILAYLAHANRYSNTLTALVDYLGATKGTVSQSVERLVERGLVERSQDAADQRVFRLRLSDAGRRLARAAAAPPAWAAAIAGDARTAAALRGILARMQQAAGRRTFGACRTCRHHQLQEDGSARCGLTGERLGVADGERWCREHALPDPPGAAA